MLLGRSIITYYMRTELLYQEQGRKSGILHSFYLVLFSEAHGINLYKCLSILHVSVIQNIPHLLLNFF